MKTYQITIAGESFPIKSDADVDHVAFLTDELQRRYNELDVKRGPRNSQAFRTMTMVALVLLDELREHDTRCDAMKEETARFIQTLVARIDRILGQGRQ